MDWQPGDRLLHRFNPDLGPGRILLVEERSLVAHFPASDTTLRLALDTDALRPLEFRPGMRGVLHPAKKAVVVAALVGEGRLLLEDGREIDSDDLWPEPAGESLSERLARGDADSLDAFSLRLETLHLAAVREADGLGSFLGGRIRLFPHQFHVATAATRSDPVRWLLADEVGLGKTVESCLILNHLLRRGRADRTLIVAPGTLVVQWLGELWRKYHQVFVLLDDKRLQDVERDYGAGFNPFDAHPRVVIAVETLLQRPRLVERAVASGLDVVIVDEAHHLRRPPGHPGNPQYRVVAPLTAAARHVLLLSATPLEDDAHGFFRLLQLLRPEEFPEGVDFEARLADGVPLPPCTSATRRDDIGGLPPRAPRAIDLDDDDEWRLHSALVERLRASPVDNPLQRARKIRRIRRALAGGDALLGILDPDEVALAKAARRVARTDPRVAWLARAAKRWRDAGDKTLVFVAHRESLEALKTAISHQVQLRVALFHEDLSPGQRDIEVAQFRLESGPSMLLSTECGGEGRNFEFCTRLVLFDLPWNPMVVEQRIGRLDRIGRDRPVEIVYFRPPAGLGAAEVHLYEALGLFNKPLGGLERELAGVEAAMEELALEAGVDGDRQRFATLIDTARRAWDRVQEAAYHELHRDPYRPESAEGILARIPADLDELNESVIVAACEQLGLAVEPQRGAATYSIELGTHARQESLPGVPGGSSFLGTFDRDEAVRNESIDFYAAGHPLVEGVLMHLEDSPLGRVAMLDVHGDRETFGLLAFYKTGPRFDAVAVDLEGRERPDLAERLSHAPIRSRRVRPETWATQPGWATLIRMLASHLEQRGRPLALAAFRIRPR